VFWEEENLGQIKKKAGLHVPPPIPETGWLPPTSFPDLTDAAVIAVDTETKEPDFDKGPGWSRDCGHIIGFSVAARDRRGNQGSWYFPVRHEAEPELNLDPQSCFKWLKANLETPYIPKVGANLLYDVGWLTEEGIEVQGELHDVQFAEALLQEEGLTALEYLGQKYCGEGKDTNLLYEWIAAAYNATSQNEIKSNFYRTSPRLVGPYGQQDADLPLRVLDKQYPILEYEGLTDVYRMECDSIPLLTKMRQTGVQIDLRKAEQLYGQLAVDVKQLERKLYDVTGIHANVESPKDLQKLFDHVGIAYPMTAAGNPSFRKEFLNSLDHPVGELIRNIREHNKIRGTFIKSYLLESNVKGRVHCQFHPLRGDSGGTRSGRYSSSNPNLQNIPVRTELGNRIRQLFIPDPGHIAWEKDDYSQIEYRMLAEFAVGMGAEDLRQEYLDNPLTDYHVKTYQGVCPYMGWEPDNKDTAKLYRKPIKNINFGLLYGMGKPKLGRAIMEYFSGNLNKQGVNALFDAYHKGNPYVKATMDQAAWEVQQHGFIRTITGRKSRFDYWEPVDIDYENRAVPLKYQAALNRYGVAIQRAHTHKGINRKLQGSAADIIKKGMVRCYQEGVFDVIGIPKLQVHDELNFSVIEDTPEQTEGYAHMRRILETAIPTRVPLIVDSDRGPNWGKAD